MRPFVFSVWFVQSLIPAIQIVAQTPTSHVLRGHVTDTLGLAVPFANVMMGQTRVTSDETGIFQLSVRNNGPLTLDIRRIGYQAVHLELPATPDTVIAVAMTPVAQRLDPMNVVARTSTTLALHGFYDRMKQREQGTLNGWFITPEDIELRHPTRTSQMIEDVPGIRLEQIHGMVRDHGPSPFIALGANGCWATVYVNGVRLNQINARNTDELKRSAVFDDITEVGSLAGIEVYSHGARAPMAYQALNGSCAVVLIWTK